MGRGLQCSTVRDPGSVRTIEFIEMGGGARRYTIVFEDLPDLHRCLDCIAADPDVTVERANNRLSRQYDAHLTAGYRYPNALACHSMLPCPKKCSMQQCPRNRLY
jgi:hypothetical protein